MACKAARRALCHFSPEMRMVFLKGNELDFVHRDRSWLPVRPMGPACEKQNEYEHRNEWLPGSARDMAIAKFPHKDSRGRVAQELQSSADPKG